MNWFIPIFIFFSPEPDLTLVYRPHHVVLAEMAQKEKRMNYLRKSHESPGISRMIVETDTMDVSGYVDTILILNDTVLWRR